MAFYKKVGYYKGSLNILKKLRYYILVFPVSRLPYKVEENEIVISPCMVDGITSYDLYIPTKNKVYIERAWYGNYSWAVDNVNKVWIHITLSEERLQNLIKLGLVEKIEEEIR